MPMLLLLAAALAQEPAPTASVEPAASIEPAPSTEPAPLQDPAVVIDRAIAVRRQGDPDAARNLLLAAEPIVPEAMRSWWLYQRGICEEMAWRPADAAALYEQVIARGGPEALDARFRLALVLEDQGRDDEALDQVLALRKAKGLDERDRVTLELQRGVAELRTGRTRRGAKRVEAALAEVEGGDTHTWMRAKARYTLAWALLEEADALALDGREKRVVKRLSGRAERMQAAEKQIIAIAALQEPEWVLAGLIDLGDSYADLADDLAASPAPRGLTEEQAALYRDELAKKSEVLRTKAWHSYDQGVALATRIGWESPRVATLKARREAMSR